MSTQSSYLSADLSKLGIRRLLGTAFALLIWNQPVDAALNDCGQPVSDGVTPTASDALYVLNAAVGLQVCDACVCDTDGSGAITAADALLTLNVAVGAGAALACESCGPSDDLDCVAEGYPCTLADADPDALDTVITILGELWDVRDAGTMADVRNYLEIHPDVESVGGNNRFVSFLVDGMPPAIFDDVTVIRDAPPAAATAPPTPRSTPERGHEVVGEDSTGDGKVDQRDIKRALILAPYLWQFSPNDESADLAARLETLPAYAGNVVFKSNPNREDTNITFDDWLSLGNYDVVALSTHGSRDCETQPDMTERCEVWISSGVEFDFANRPDVRIVGGTLSGIYDDDDMESQNFGRVELRLDFFRNYYGGALDNQLVSFSACETGRAEGETLAAAMGGDDFVMTGWSEVVPVTAAFPTALAFYEELSKGLTTTEAFDIIAGLGLFPVVNSDGLMTSFETFEPQGDPVRIIELPRLIYETGDLPEGFNIVQLVDGTVGDQEPDNIELTVQIDGVTQDSIGDFQVRYRVDDQDTPGSYNLSGATLVPGFEYRYEVVHDVAVGFPLSGGELPLEVIVDLPEGGDSRYSVTASLASCSFNARASGDASFDFEGPAQFELGGDGALSVTLRSRGFINADLSRSIQGGFTTGALGPLSPTSYGLESAFLSVAATGYNAQFFEGLEDFDCPSCGGTVTLTSVEEENIAGSALVTIPRITPMPEEGQMPTVTLDVDFIAAFGSVFQGTSPYVRCSIQYDDEEQ